MPGSGGPGPFPPPSPPPTSQEELPGFYCLVAAPADTPPGPQQLLSKACGAPGRWGGGLAWTSSQAQELILRILFVQLCRSEDCCQTRVLIFIVFLEQQGCYYKRPGRVRREAKKRDCTAS